MPLKAQLWQSGTTSSKKCGKKNAWFFCSVHFVFASCATSVDFSKFFLNFFKLNVCLSKKRGGGKEQTFPIGVGPGNQLKFGRRAFPIRGFHRFPAFFHGFRIFQRRFLSLLGDELYFRFVAFNGSFFKAKCKVMQKV